MKTDTKYLLSAVFGLHLKLLIGLILLFKLFNYKEYEFILVICN